MAESSNLEYCLLHYVPNLLRDKSVSIAAIVFNSGDLENGICTMIYAADWQINVRLLEPNTDLEMLNAVLTEIRNRLLSPSQRSDMIRQMEDSFSNVIQVSQRRKYRFDARPEAIGDFARRLLRKTSKISLGPFVPRAVKCEATL
jgi:hypothetical protein